uniref:Putative cell death activator cide-b protein n=1 Tax=Amblyomma sculptum TaxID=1581419 RepID=A0A1E1XTC3_AMBSC
MTTEDLAGKPHKVWSCDRQTRKCVVASSLDELRTKGAAKLGYNNPFDLKIVLETDGTEVEDENYFQRAERDTVFLMLQPNEKWLPPGVEALRAGCDVVDSSGEECSVFSSGCLDPLVLLRHLETDTGKLALFTEEQLEVLSEMPVESVDPDVFNTTFVETVVDTCGRLLVEKREAREAIEFIKVFSQNSQSSQDETDGSTPGPDTPGEAIGGKHSREADDQSEASAKRSKPS